VVGATLRSSPLHRDSSRFYMEKLHAPGSAYAALLVDGRYRPQVTVEATALRREALVLAVATAEGNTLVQRR